jgi:hypothetical protein
MCFCLQNLLLQHRPVSVMVQLYSFLMALDRRLQNSIGTRVRAQAQKPSNEPALLVPMLSEHWAGKERTGSSKRSAGRWYWPQLLKQRLFVSYLS